MKILPQAKDEPLYAQPFKGEDGKDYVHILGGNNEVVAVTQHFKNAAGATAAAQRLANADILFRPRVKTRSSK